MPDEQHHYRCQTALIYSQEDPRFETPSHDPQASKEGSIQWETAHSQNTDPLHIR